MTDKSEPFSNFADEPVYNIQAVAQQTTIDRVTLRAWERRYEIPKPKRGPHEHRLYSERDIMILRWLKQRTDESMRIKQAVDLMYQQSPQNLLEPINFTHTTLRTERIDALVQEFCGAIGTFDAAQGHQILTYAFSIHPIEDVCLKLIVPSLNIIGERWQGGKLNLHMEHFASNLIRERLISILAGTPPPTRQGRILIGCAPYDWHEIGALIFSLLVRRRGWDVIYLGQNVGLRGLSETLKEVRPDVLTLSVSRIASVRYLSDVAKTLAQVTGGRGIFTFGGGVFDGSPQLIKHLPGVYLGSDLFEAVENIEKLLTPTIRPSIGETYDPTEIPSDVEAASHEMQRSRGVLQGAVTTIMRELAPMIDMAEISQVAHEVMEVVSTALRYNEPTILDDMRDWAVVTLPDYNVTASHISNFVAQMQDFVGQQLPPREGRVINAFLEHLLPDYS